MIPQTESAVITALLEMAGITPEKVREHLEAQIQEEVRVKRLFWDIEKMSEATCLDKSYLQRHILMDARMKEFERRRGQGKRIWLYEGSVQALFEIVDEWI